MRNVVILIGLLGVCACDSGTNPLGDAAEADVADDGRADDGAADAAADADADADADAEGGGDADADADGDVDADADDDAGDGGVVWGWEDGHGACLLAVCAYGARVEEGTDCGGCCAVTVVDCAAEGGYCAEGWHGDETGWSDFTTCGADSCCLPTADDCLGRCDVSCGFGETEAPSAECERAGLWCCRPEFPSTHCVEAYGRCDASCGPDERGFPARGCGAQRCCLQFVDECGGPCGATSCIYDGPHREYSVISADCGLCCRRVPPDCLLSGGICGGPSCRPGATEHPALECRERPCCVGGYTDCAAAGGLCLGDPSEECPPGEVPIPADECGTARCCVPGP